MALVIKGSSSGQVTVDVPAAAGTNTITIPASTGTMLDTNSVIASSKLPAGSIVQIIHASTTTQTGTTAASFTATNVTADITPIATANKIIVMVSSSMYISAAGQQASGTIYRDSTNLGDANRGIVQFWDGGDVCQGDMSIMLTDHPNTTSAVTYALYIRKLSASGSACYAGVDATPQFITLLEVQG